MPREAQPAAATARRSSERRVTPTILIGTGANTDVARPTNATMVGLV